MDESAPISLSPSIFLPLDDRWNFSGKTAGTLRKIAKYIGGLQPFLTKKYKANKLIQEFKFGLKLQLLEAILAVHNLTLFSYVRVHIISMILFYPNNLSLKSIF